MCLWQCVPNWQEQHDGLGNFGTSEKQAESVNVL